MQHVSNAVSEHCFQAAVHPAVDTLSYVGSVVYSSSASESDKRDLALLNALSLLASNDGGYEEAVRITSNRVVETLSSLQHRVQLNFVDMLVCTRKSGSCSPPARSPEPRFGLVVAFARLRGY